MNREQELQKEIEKYKRYEKASIRIFWIVFSIGIALFVASVVYRSVAVEPKPTERQIMPFQRDYEPEWYLYKDGTKGTLSHHPITHEKGVLINKQDSNKTLKLWVSITIK